VKFKSSKIVILTSSPCFNMDCQPQAPHAVSYSFKIKFVQFGENSKMGKPWVLYRVIGDVGGETGDDVSRPGPCDHGGDRSTM
jgi:hypothetical protein